MTNRSFPLNQWQPWTGGKCPVPKGTKIVAMFRRGDSSQGNAEFLDWLHYNRSDDVIAFRVTEYPPAEESAPEPAGEDMLLPCPFCGSTNVELHWYRPLFGGRCFDCYAEGPKGDEEQALAAWNRRAPSPAPAGDGGEPFGYWIEHKAAEPFFLRPPAYIPTEPNYRVTSLYLRPDPEPIVCPDHKDRRLRMCSFCMIDAFEADLRDERARAGKAEAEAAKLREALSAARVAFTRLFDNAEAFVSKHHDYGAHGRPEWLRRADDAICELDAALTGKGGE